MTAWLGQSSARAKQVPEWWHTYWRIHWRTNGASGEKILFKLLPLRFAMASRSSREVRALQTFCVGRVSIAGAFRKGKLKSILFPILMTDMTDILTDVRSWEKTASFQGFCGKWRMWRIFNEAPLISMKKWDFGAKIDLDNPIKGMWIGKKSSYFCVSNGLENEKGWWFVVSVTRRLWHVYGDCISWYKNAKSPEFGVAGRSCKV